MIYLRQRHITWAKKVNMNLNNKKYRYILHETKRYLLDLTTIEKIVDSHDD